MSKVLKSLGILLVLCSTVHAVQDQRYPTSAVTKVRLDTYDDANATIAYSNFKIVDSTWTCIVDSTTYIFPQNVYGAVWDFNRSTYTYVNWPISDFIHLIQEQEKMNLIQQIVIDDEEEYYVQEGTNTFAEDGWKGWCQDENGIAIACLTPTPTP